MSCTRRRAAWLAVVVVVVLAACPATFAQQFPFGVKIEKILDNTVELSEIVQAPTGELWLLERATGTIRVYVNGKQSTTLTIPVTGTCQSGLLDASFAPDFASSGVAFVSYVDVSNKLRVDRVLRNGNSLSLGTLVLDLGAVLDNCRPGGGLQVGKDGKLYIGTGDLGSSGNAQVDSHTSGKVLRANLDGTVPSDNPSGNLAWSKGFRNNAGLAYNPDTSRAGGTFYATDIGANSGAVASDEINVVTPAGNHAWDIASGMYGNGTNDPIVTWGTAALVNPESMTVLRTSKFGPAYQNALLAATPTNNTTVRGKVRAFTLTGPELATLGEQKTFLDPVLEMDGTADAQCPFRINTVAMAGDGWVYSSNLGNNPGIWRFWYDGPGAREVSSPGSPFAMTVERNGNQLNFGWENIGSLDAGRTKRFATGQRAERYRVYEGTLPIAGGTYNHAAVLSTDGTADGQMRLTATLAAPGTGNRYYLVGAQNDNLEGTLGNASSSTARTIPGTRDYCDVIGRGRSVGTCAREFQNEATGAPLRLKDYNPKSPTYGQTYSLADFRGKVVKMALTSENCYWCTVEAEDEGLVDKQYRDRDFLFVSIFTLDYGIWHVPSSEADCQTRITNWANTYNTPSIILCDIDANGDGYGDISNWYDQCNCAPQNFYIDQGGVIYSYVQGAHVYDDVVASISAEVNAPTCD